MQVSGLSPTPGGDAVKDGLGALGVGAQRGGIVGGHVAGGDGIDVESIGGQFIRQQRV